MIASYGLKFILIALLMTVLCCLGAAWRDSKLLFALAVLFAVVTVFLSFFYRSPARTIQAEPGMILSTADGKVLAVRRDRKRLSRRKGNQDFDFPFGVRSAYQPDSHRRPHRLR